MTLAASRNSIVSHERWSSRISNPWGLYESGEFDPVALWTNCTIFLINDPFLNLIWPLLRSPQPLTWSLLKSGESPWGPSSGLFPRISILFLFLFWKLSFNFSTRGKGANVQLGPGMNIARAPLNGDYTSIWKKKKKNVNKR